MIVPLRDIRAVRRAAVAGRSMLSFGHSEVSKMIEGGRMKLGYGFVVSEDKETDVKGSETQLIYPTISAATTISAKEV